MKFQDIAGYDNIKAQLRSMRNTCRVPHALLFRGADESGVCTLAWIFAAYLNCYKPTATEEPCGCCPSCLKYKVWAHPDLFVLYPIVGEKVASTDFLPLWRTMVGSTNYFTLDKWRELIKAANSRPIIYSRESEWLEESLSYSIAEARYRVLIIWHADRMHDTLSNKLLKLIEEPPNGTLIFLVSDKSEDLLPTIVSRVQQIDFPKLDTDTILASLQGDSSFASLPIERLTEAAHLALGSYPMALELLNEFDEHENDRHYLLRLFEVASNHSNLALLKSLSDDLAGLGREKQMKTLSYFINTFREFYICNLRQPELNYLHSADHEISTRYAPSISGKNIRAISTELELAIFHISRNVNARIVLFDTLLRLVAAIAPALRK